MGQSISRVFISPKTHFNNSFSQDRVKKKKIKEEIKENGSFDGGDMRS